MDGSISISWNVILTIIIGVAGFLAKSLYSDIMKRIDKSENQNYEQEQRMVRIETKLNIE